VRYRRLQRPRHRGHWQRRRVRRLRLRGSTVGRSGTRCCLGIYRGSLPKA
jgi:hypothetical protein